MTRIQIAVAADSPIKVKETVLVSESKGKSKSKGRTPRQQFFSALMTRLAGDTGNNVSAAFVDDRHKFKSMMMDIVKEMADVDGDE